MPLIEGSRGRLEVAGKGSPEIYIDNRLVRDKAELKRLPATDIKDIQIITHPDARYGADVRAVIRIRTKHRLEGLSGTFYANAGQSEKTSGKASANLAYTFKQGLSLFGGADFDDAGFRQERQYHEVFNGGRFHTDTHGINSNRTRRLTANAGLVYDFKENSVGVRYDFQRSLPSDYLARNTEQTDTSAFSAITSMYNNREDTYNHHVNTYLVVKPWAKATLTGDGDYVTNGSASLGHLAEQAGREEIAAASTHNQGHYHVAAGKMNLETALLGGTLDGGGQYTYMLNRQVFDKEATGETPDLPGGTNKETQHLMAFYLSYQHVLGRYWSWKAGLRYELADFTYYLNGRKMVGWSEFFRDWLPHAQVSYNP